MRRFLVPVLVVLAVASCRWKCTAIGAEPGVIFRLGHVLTARPMDVRACVEDTCVSHRARTGRWQDFFVQDPSLTGPRNVEVSIQIGGPGSKPHTYEATIGVHRVQPNGPGCDPLVYQAAVELREDGLHELP